MVVGRGSSSLLLSHLGVPVGQSTYRPSSWPGLMDRFTYMLSAWMARYLSIGGRHTLLKSILQSLGMYLMPHFLVLLTVLISLESLRALFF